MSKAAHIKYQDPRSCASMLLSNSTSNACVHEDGGDLAVFEENTEVHICQFYNLPEITLLLGCAIMRKWENPGGCSI